MNIGAGYRWNSEATHGGISEMSTNDPHPGHAGLFKLNSTSAQYSPLSRQGPATVHQSTPGYKLLRVSRMRTSLQVTNEEIRRVVLACCHPTERNTYAIPEADP